SRRSTRLDATAPWLAVCRARLWTRGARRASDVSAWPFAGKIIPITGPFAGLAQHSSLLGDWRRTMKLRRLIPIVLAAYSVWKRLSPAQKRGLRNKISGATTL